MLTSKATSPCIAQFSISSIESNDSEVSSTNNSIQYDLIEVRLCRRSAPTLETGRRSKYLVLFGDEAAKREKRREKNRDAARKLKEKRELIEYELNLKLKQLEDEHSNLENDLKQLQQIKENLEEKINQLYIDPIIEFLFSDNQDLLDLCDESIEHILNFDLNSVMDN